jgi:hypothetical protein
VCLVVRYMACDKWRHDMLAGGEMDSWERVLRVHGGLRWICFAQRRGVESSFILLLHLQFIPTHCPRSSFPNMLSRVLPEDPRIPCSHTT